MQEKDFKDFFIYRKSKLREIIYYTKIIPLFKALRKIMKEDKLTSFRF